jgi:hypothetical protein
VHAYLYSKKWETRTAAADTIGALADAFPHHAPAELAAAAAGAADEGDAAGVCGGSGSGGDGTWEASVMFEGVDLQQVVDYGQPLLASGSQVGLQG